MEHIFKYVFSFDPGKMSGWSYIKVIVHENNPEGVVTNWQVGEADHFEIGDKLRTIGLPKLEKNDETVFVCESFKQNSRMPPSPWSLETLGLIRYWSHFYDIPFYTQAPSEAKSLIKDSTLRRTGLWTPGLRHANDAVLHGVYWLVKERNLLTSCLQK